MGKPFYYFSRCLYSLGRPVYPTKVIGRENIIKKGKCIYACNHLSAVDIPLTQVHIPGYRRYIGKVDFTERKSSKFLLSRFGVIFIDRERPALSTMREIFKVLDNGQILIFPEGTRNKGDESEMGELKTGLALFAAKSGAPVVPVLLYRRPKAFRKNYMYIGEPIDVIVDKGRMPTAAEAEAITARYAHEFARLRVRLCDYVENKRWKRKNRLKTGEIPPALAAFDAEHPAPLVPGEAEGKSE
ncbi:MAG TPA: 1-acyl-sn-glycerol-3-phosphate acyltransferase [Candidatus Protoclostridium stercorigallinarum]|uniref:1-acyl-sn-glycerol-3-phosphate acyltransferase n=1 Tax=Candidatus Protoclostridium stercorigallinarum TaxID=2838741 RepID=A0A9D1TQZ2_9FIRM|nr:1-acyl-sn-glycerol-3-phosphate acyltransferase [Candidatus Protoclostridium stercorigallinarum]